MKASFICPMDEIFPDNSLACLLSYCIFVFFTVLPKSFSCSLFRYAVSPSCAISFVLTDLVVFTLTQIENYNEPYLNALSEYDDGRDLTSYDFEADCFSSPYDDVNKKKLAYRHRAIGEKYAKVTQELPCLSLFTLKFFLHKIIQA
jgi:hypothetical protein